MNMPSYWLFITILFLSCPLLPGTVSVSWIYDRVAIRLFAIIVINFWQKNVSELFLKFYLNSCQFWPCFQRDGKVIQKNSVTKTNEFIIILKNRWNFSKFENLAFFLNYSEFIRFCFGISLNYSAVSLKAWPKWRKIQMKFQKKFRHWSVRVIII